MKKILIGAFCIFAYLIIMPGTGVANANVGEFENLEVGRDPLQDAINENLNRIRLETEKMESEVVSTVADIKAKIDLESRVKAREQYWAGIEEREKQEAIQAKQSREPKETKKVVSQNSSTKTFKLSFYSTLPEENGGYANMANGQPIERAQMVIASNYYPIGTKIYLEGWGTMTVSDRGGSAFNNPSRLDVLIQRKSGESNAAYRQRISNLGRQTTSGYIVR